MDPPPPMPYQTSGPIAKLYALLFGRQVDQPGLAFWSERYGSGETLSSIAAAMLATAEGRNSSLVGLPTSDEGWQALINAGTPIPALVNEHRATPTAFLPQTLEASQLREQMLADARHRTPPPIWVHGYRAFSQADEDGILSYILGRLHRRTGTFLEIGASDGLENNTTYLLLQGWQGIWIEADPELTARARRRFRHFIDAGRLTVIEGRVTPDNFSAVLDRLPLTDQIEVLSIDIDGHDHAMAAACLKRMRVEVAVVEYNPRFGPLVDWVMPSTPGHVWQQDDWYGASLNAFDRLFGQHGLELVGCNIVGSNAFFVEATRASAAFDGPFTPAAWYEPARYYLLPAFHGGHPANRDPERALNLPPQLPGT